jgi:hypothetical protein
MNSSGRAHGHGKKRAGLFGAGSYEEGKSFA